jgi:hypothetical protein
MVREKTRFEHRWEISEVDGWSDFGDANLHLDYRVGCSVAGCSGRSVVVTGR